MHPQHRIRVLRRKPRQARHFRRRLAFLGDVAAIEVEVVLARHRGHRQDVGPVPGHELDQAIGRGPIRVRHRRRQAGLQAVAVAGHVEAAERPRRIVGVEHPALAMDPQHRIRVLRRKPRQIPQFDQFLFVFTRHTNRRPAEAGKPPHHTTLSPPARASVKGRAWRRTSIRLSQWAQLCRDPLNSAIDDSTPPWNVEGRTGHAVRPGRAPQLN